MPGAWPSRCRTATPPTLWQISEDDGLGALKRAMRLRQNVIGGKTDPNYTNHPAGAEIDPVFAGYTVAA